MPDILEDYVRGTLKVKKIYKKYPDLLVDLCSITDDELLWHCFPPIKNSEGKAMEIQIHLENRATNILEKIDKEIITKNATIEQLLEFVEGCSYRHVNFAGSFVEYMLVSMKQQLSAEQRRKLTRNKNRFAKLLSCKPYVDYKKEDSYIDCCWSHLPDEIIFVSIGKFIQLPMLEVLRRQHPYWDVTFKDRMKTSPAERRAYARITDQVQYYGPVCIPEDIMRHAFFVEYLFMAQRYSFLDEWIPKIDRDIMRVVLKELSLNLLMTTILGVKELTAKIILEVSHDKVTNILALLTEDVPKEVVLQVYALATRLFPKDDEDAS